MTTLTAPRTPAARVGRDGWLELEFARQGDRTVLRRSAFATPLQIMTPLALDDPACVVSILNPTGGVVGGDRLTIDVVAAAGAHACLTTPSATKVYRTTGALAEQRVRLRAECGAVVEWVPDHTIPYAGSRYRQSLEAHVADGAALVLVDAFSAGRVASGECWRFGYLESQVSVVDAAGAIVYDRFAISGGDDWQQLGFAEFHTYFASILAIGEVDADRLAVELDRLSAAAAVVATARLQRRGVLARCLAADAPSLGSVVDAAWTVARAALGLPRLGLRKP